MAGAWRMNDNGEFELTEYYERHLKEAKRRASDAWTEAIFSYLSNRSGYTMDQLDAEFTKRVTERGGNPTEVVDEFIVQCLEREL